MDIRQFRSELAEVFEASGFEHKKLKGTKATLWVLPGQEVERAFWEDALRRPWGFLLSGALTVDVPAFRRWLEQRFPTDQHGILRNNLLSRHIANERDMFFAVEQEKPPYEAWVRLIRQRLAVLPDTIEGLLKARREETQGLRLVWDYYSSPKAWSYFEAWATGDEPSAPPPHCLPTGEIVDIAANDPA